MRSNMPSIDFSSSDDVIVIVGGNISVGEAISSAFRNCSVDFVGALVTPHSVLGPGSNELLVFRDVSVK